MRKQTKIAAVVSAAALLALGASITSFAAVKGTWQMGDDGEWYCYDKNGDVIENEFCVDNGKEFYVGDDGTIVRTDWIDDGDARYFARSNGEKVINDWRLVAPYDDEDSEEEWYYFQSTGKMAANKKLVIKGQTYYFDADGKMLTGWVNGDSYDEASSYSSDMVYCNDETGARLKSEWILSTEPGTDEDDADADEYYYYIGSKGKPSTGKNNNIKGQTYFFDVEGRMLSGWVAESGSDYAEIGYEDSTEVIGSGDTVYFCGDSDDGHMKKNKWIKMWKPSQYYDADEDDGKKWYWLDKNGKVFVPATASNAAKFDFEDGDLVYDELTTVAEKKINSKTYYFNSEGQMVTGFVLMADGMFYFGGSDDGSMKTGAQTIADDTDENYKFYFETKTDSAKNMVKGVGVTGQKSGKLYCDGKLIVAEDAKYEVWTITDSVAGTSYSYIVNQSGSIQHKAIEYKEDGDVIIDATGWTFNESDGYTKYCITSFGSSATGSNAN